MTSADRRKNPAEDTKTGFITDPGELNGTGDTTRSGSLGEAKWELPEPGARIGPYTIQGELGRGGMGIVYRAFDEQLQRDVALKLLRPELVGTSVSRFLEEARVTAQLQHPVILPVFDVGRLPEGGIYYTMQLVYGQTFEQLVRDALFQEDSGERGALDALGTGWSRFKFLQIFTTVCRAVAYAHKRGVIHRDLKPSNVMIGPFGELYVMDWGLAKILGTKNDPSPESPFPMEAIKEVAGREDTRTGVIVGTPAYMAPEQAQGKSGDVGIPADIYCLGGILYFLLTGHSPRAGSASEIVQDLRNASPPPPPSMVRDDVPPELDELCAQALAADPQERPPTAEVLANTVQAYLEGRAPPATTPEDSSTMLATITSFGYARPSIKVEVVVILPRAGQAPLVYLGQRFRQPFADMWTCPGVPIGMEEELEVAARRALKQRADLDPSLPLEPLGTWGDPKRDPRTRVVTIAYLCWLRAADHPPTRGPEEGWFELSESGGVPRLRRVDLPEDKGPFELAFDHEGLLLKALERMPKGSP